VTAQTDRQARGRQILARMQSYPLAPSADRRDYVFYFVPESDEYGKYARVFFRTYYPRHVGVRVTSLEHLFTVLERDMARARANVRIREIVVVAHSNSWGVLAPLTHKDYLARKANDDDGLEWYANHLARLQRTILSEHIDFQRARARVLRHLDDASWVTVRSCNFGFSPEGMYALWTVFGGRANLYALRAYMTFATIALGDDARLKSDDEAYDYLRKQGLLDRATPPATRARAQVRPILARNGNRLPVQFFIPEETVHDYFEGMVARIAANPPYEGGEPPPVPYEKLMDELDNRRPETLLKILKRESQGLTFTGRPRLAPTNRRREWTLQGRVAGTTRTYHVRETGERMGDGSARREVKVFEPVRSAQKLGSEPPWTMYGVPYDVPGTEVQAYLDRFSIDDLVGLQEIVRSGYRSRDAIVIEQAQRSIGRRLHFMSWFTETPCFRMELRDPLFGPEGEESCYWSPYPPRGLKDHEMNDLRATAHVDHNGYGMWVDVKAAQAPEVQFREDVFLEHPLPDYAATVSDYRGLDTASLGDESPAEPRRRRQGGRLARRKDEPLDAPDPGTGPATEVLRGLSDEDLLKALTTILEQRKLGPDVTSAQAQRVVEVADLTLTSLIAVITEVGAWAPSSLIGRLALSEGFWLGAEGFYATIVSPLVGWVLITVDFRRATEAHRAMGMRAALRQATGALRTLSFRLGDGRDVAGLTIPAVTAEGNVNREFELKKYVLTARKAVEEEHFGFIHEKFLEGYDLVIGETAKLANEVIRETDDLVRQQLRGLGLTDRQVELVLESGVIDMKKVYAVAFEGLARILSEQTSKFVVE
jgi:hypothetical protein